MAAGAAGRVEVGGAVIGVWGGGRSGLLGGWVGEKDGAPAGVCVEDLRHVDKHAHHPSRVPLLARHTCALPQAPFQA